MSPKKFISFPGVLLLLFFFLPVSCKKDNRLPAEDNPEETDAPGFSIQSKDVDGLQIVSVNVEGYTLTNSLYDIKVGGKEIKAVKAEGNTLTFLVPGDLPSGRYEVKASFTPNTIELNIKAPSPITDPEKAFKAVTEQIYADIEEEPPLADTALSARSIKEIKKSIDDAVTKFNALPAAEKQLTAQFLAANLKQFNQGKQLINELRSMRDGMVMHSSASKLKISAMSCDYKCYLSQLVKVVLFAAIVAGGTSVASLTGVVVVGLDVGLSIITGKNSLLISTVRALLEEGLNWTFFPHIESTMTYIKNGAEKILGTIRTSAVSGDFYILKGEPVTFELQPVYSTVQRKDADRIPVIGELIAAYDAFKVKYNAGYVQKFGALPDFSDKKEKKDAENLSDWQIVVTKGNGITASAPNGTPANFTVVFNSTSAERQPLEFDIVFKGPVEDIKEHVSATFITKRKAFSAAIAGGNTQAGTLGTKLPEKLSVKVVDSKNNPVEDTKVTWSTNGGGSVTGESTTDAQGVAYAEWTLGSSGTQTVTAMVVDEDGIALQGSPLLFTANEAIPYSIQIASGNHQDGQLGKKLPAPLGAKITDDKGNALPGVKVQWAVSAGQGSLSAAESITGSNGIATVEWTLGSSGLQSVTASARKKDGSNVLNAPVKFEAGTGQDQSEKYKAAVVGRYLVTSGDQSGVTDFYAEIRANGRVSYYPKEYPNLETSTLDWSIKRSADGYRFILGTFPDRADDGNWEVLSIPVNVMRENIFSMSATEPVMKWRPFRTWTRVR